MSCNTSDEDLVYLGPPTPFSAKPNPSQSAPAKPLPPDSLNLVVDASKRVDIIDYHEPSDTYNGLVQQMAQQMILRRDEYSQTSVISQHGGPPKALERGCWPYGVIDE
ncbi:hypothetical protein KCU77_g2162, partial [Aureobasidium melanogenum]